MKLTDVAIVAVEGFSPFHYAVPCMLFGDSVSEIKRFNLHICAERPGLLRARDGFALYATGDYAALEQADIVVVPYWGEVDRRPPQALLDSLVRARDNGAEIVGQAQFIAQPVPKNTRDARINCLLDYLQQHIAEPHSLDSLARVVAMSRRTLTRHFARATGMSITDWLTAERLRRSQTLLEAGDLPVEQVAEAVGYLSAVTWRQQFKARFGVSPTEWRRTFRRGA